MSTYRLFISASFRDFGAVKCRGKWKCGGSVFTSQYNLLLLLTAQMFIITIILLFLI